VREAVERRLSVRQRQVGHASNARGTAPETPVGDLRTGSNALHKSIVDAQELREATSSGRRGPRTASRPTVRLPSDR
jgi:hypothetical protein